MFRFLSETHVVAQQSRVIYQWLQLEQLDEWWHWVLLLTICLLIVGYVVFWYRRDSAEQLRPTGWALTTLRLAALAGILLFFMQLDKRVETRVVRDSKVAVLVDTSLSMTLPGTPSIAGVPNSASRSDEAIALLTESPLIEELSAEHQVTIYRFDATNRPIAVAAFDKAGEQIVPVDEEDSGSATGPDVAAIRLQIWLAAAVLLGSLICFLVSWSAQIAGAKTWKPGAWMLLTGSILLIIGMTWTATAIVPPTEIPLPDLLGMEGSAEPEQTGEKDPDSSADSPTLAPENWAESLRATGIESRMGDALKSILDRELGNPLAGIVLVTDGKSNAGLNPRAAIASARNARVPIFVVGVGSQSSPPNLQVVELDVPRRLFPGDRFSLSTLIGAQGYASKDATVQILTGPEGAADSDLQIEAEKQVTFETADQLLAVGFELSPKTLGSWTYKARVISTEDDADPGDNSQETTTEVIERKNRVLLVAGGPTREYQFVRNLLYRDKNVDSHVLLQSGSDLTSQESQQLLDTFPADRAELSQYDAVIAFDADWSKIPDSSVIALEEWVSEQAGGFMLIAGSVEMPKWMTRSASGRRSLILRDLSPVVLDARGSARLAAGRIEAEEPWPLKLTEDGKQMDFLWLSDDPQTSARLWEEFEGVYSYYSAYSLKPGAKALALFSDPLAAVDGQLPIYLSSQFYGSGRCVFQGGGEMWRIRRLSDAYFDRYYTKLVRWISQGRLLLDSDRGVLLVDREQAFLGEEVTVRAVLKNERYEPLVQSEVIARLADPQGRNLPLPLRPLTGSEQPGVYVGQFPVLQAGQYQIQLQLGGLSSEEILETSIRSRVPALEMQNTERNDPLLNQLAQQTNGRIWFGASQVLEAAQSSTNPASQSSQDTRTSLAASLAPQDQVSYLPGSPDREFQLRWLGWLMAFIAMTLSMEWLSRRLHRLA